jgi:DNA sulfur modification protein DndD
MFISKVILKYFRIYNQIQELSFPRNGKKNVFIISGNNGFGKTTLLNSLVWCLYGKQMVDVDDKFRKEIYEAGGYKKFATNNLNKLARLKGETSYRVSLTLSDVSIPSLSCKEVKITRVFDVENTEEQVEILVDGMENELTREVGHEIFISDFILPKEIAKFFFFDAEKIVSLAEIKSTDDKRKLSRAYSEVLGIKKYEDLKDNLEDLRIRLRRNSVSEKDKEKFEGLQKEITQFRNLVKEYESQIFTLQEEKASKKHASEQYQEKLIREGNSITVEELSDLRRLKAKLTDEADAIKIKLKELLDLAPFAIAGNKLVEVKNQMMVEIESARQSIDPELIKNKTTKIQKDFTHAAKKLNINHGTLKKLNVAIEQAVLKQFDTADKNKEFKVLLDFSDSEKNEFNAIYNNLKHSFSEVLKNLTAEYKNNRIAFNKVVRKLSNAETKENDLLIKEIRQQKTLLDKRIEEIDKKIIELSQEIGGLHREIIIKSKVAAELSKKIELQRADQIKDETAQRLITELNEFIRKLKFEKKASLEQRIKKELNSLIHKRNFIGRVEVEIGSDIIDIHLYDKKGEYIPKETLSKGEQQLYATALLKSLVEESNINFPVFIDSPLQKFDKKHSRNIICEFYPKISEQVVLFPLLEKELTEVEYGILQSRVNKTFLINNMDEYYSQFVEVDPVKLFAQSKTLYEDVYQH